MAQLRYSVGVTLPDDATAQVWLDWLHHGHVSEVFAGGAISAEIVKLDGEPHSFEVIYRFPDRKAFATYERDHAPRLRAEGLRFFPPERGIRYRRSTGEIIDSLRK